MTQSSKLRQLFFRIQQSGEQKNSRYTTPFRFSLNCFVISDCRELRSPIDVTLRFAVNVRAYSCEIIALAKIRQWPAVVPSYEVQRKPRLAAGLDNNVGLRRRKFLQETHETERVSTR